MAIANHHFIVRRRQVVKGRTLNMQLYDFTRKNSMTIALAAGPPILIWYFLQRESTELTATILTDVPVVSIREDFEAAIELRYKGDPVNGLRVVELQLTNTGTQPIERSAFESPVQFTFGSGKVTDPVITRARPESLHPTLRVAQGGVVLEPLLLNPDDSFVFRSFVVGGVDSTRIKVAGRVRGISSIALRDVPDTESKWPLIFSLVAGILGVMLSMFSAVRLGKKFSRLAKRLPLGRVNRLAERIEEDLGTAARANQFAKELQIAEHDSKANLLFLRIRIESMLRDLARKADIPRREQLASMRRLAVALGKEGAVSEAIVAAIADISPAVNRELHEVDRYLSDEEFYSLQRLGLSVIAGLSVALDKYSRRGTT